jgi:predicted nucleic acid-binding Zn ribbon protein
MRCLAALPYSRRQGREQTLVLVLVLVVVVVLVVVQ